MSFPALARLGLMQKWTEGQDGELRDREFGFKDPMPVTAPRKVRGMPKLAGSRTRQYPNAQQINLGSKDVLGEASGGRWRKLS